MAGAAGRRRPASSLVGFAALLTLQAAWRHRRVETLPCSRRAGAAARCRSTSPCPRAPRGPYGCPARVDRPARAAGQAELVNSTAGRGRDSCAAASRGRKKVGEESLRERSARHENEREEAEETGEGELIERVLKYGKDRRARGDRGAWWRWTTARRTAGLLRAGRPDGQRLTCSAPWSNDGSRRRVIHVSIRRAASRARTALALLRRAG